MPIINESLKAEIDIEFLCSPGYEMVESLHVIGNPEHHTGCFHWAKATIKELPKWLYEEIIFFYNNYREWLLIADIWTLTPGVAMKVDTLENVEKGVNEVINMREPYFTYLFLGLSTTNIKPERANEWIGHPEKIDEEEWQEILNNIKDRSSVEYYLLNADEIKKRMKKVIEHYWQCIFQYTWPQLESYILNKLEEEKIKWARNNPIDYLKEMHENVKYDGKTFLFIKDPDFGIEASKIKHIRMLVSVFASPHLMINVIDDMVVGTYNADFRTAQIEKEFPEELLIYINALNDRTRLKIISLIWNDFATTTELSEVISITPGAISQQLKILKEAGLVETKRIKKHVYYKIKKEILQDVGKAIKEYFGE